MNNDRLINEARHLYAVLQVEQLVQATKNIAGIERLDRAVLVAYCRYQRRLNRCVLCYRVRLDDCNQGFEGKERKFCPASNKHFIDRCIERDVMQKNQLSKPF